MTIIFEIESYLNKKKLHICLFLNHSSFLIALGLKKGIIEHIKGKIEYKNKMLNASLCKNKSEMNAISDFDKANFHYPTNICYS